MFGNTPVDVVKTRMQGLEAHKYKNSWDCVKKIAKNEGLKAYVEIELLRVHVTTSFSLSPSPQVLQRDHPKIRTRLC